MVNEGQINIAGNIMDKDESHVTNFSIILKLLFKLEKLKFLNKYGY